MEAATANVMPRVLLTTMFIVKNAIIQTSIRDGWVKIFSDSNFICADFKKKDSGGLSSNAV